ncbi:unnamed protein product [Staurois parvus]|uniref:Uncharacterized protein n=1 Tax=Staurois parvus TaxID=386267 RepID=A0ABN9DV85_9NEOB|nr:unnamed protein product [Staurois parvus]
MSKALNMPIIAVTSPIKKWKVRGSFETKPRSGRPRKIAATTARRIVRDSMKPPPLQDLKRNPGCSGKRCCGC